MCPVDEHLVCKQHVEMGRSGSHSFCLSQHASGQVETFMWILEEAPASVTIRNADECAALHLLV